MISLIWKWLVGGCQHHWEIISEDSIERRDVYQRRLGVVATRYMMQCKHCGKLKSEKHYF